MRGLGSLGRLGGLGLSTGAVLPPPGYAFVIQNNRVVTQAGKPVIRKVA